jgi:hypothetical protein
MRFTFASHPFRITVLVSVAVLAFGFFFPTSIHAAQIHVPTTEEEATQVPTEEEMMLQAIQAAPPIDIEGMINQAIEDNTSITTNPATPGPNEDVTATLTSSQIDLEVATISWYVNGTLMEHGGSMTDFSFHTGGLGTQSTVQAVIVTPDGKTYKKAISVRPASIELAWEALTYTPPFYKGKALASPGSILKIVAIPHFVGSSGQQIAPENLVYTWTVGEGTDEKGSGIGKFVFYTDGPSTYRGATIHVKVRTVDDGLSAESEITINPSNPKVLFYEEKPLEGIAYGKALLGTITVPDGEMTVTAEPFFFTKENLNLRWFVDNVLASSTTPTLTVSRNQTIRATFSNITEAIQSATSLLNINLNGPSLSERQAF